MKRFWIGISILALLLVSSVGVIVCLDRTMSQITDDLRLAQSAAASGDLEAAQKAVAAARQRWEHNRPLAACLANHGPLELVNQGFQELEVWARAGDSAQYEALCCILGQQIEALVQEVTPYYYNIL